MGGKSFTLPSFAKINLYLRVIGKTQNGFHELCTVFQTVSLRDFLDFSEHDEIALTCSVSGIPLGADNLIVRAATLLQKHAGIKGGARIHLTKNIPAPGGLGGGSSNAAVALLGLSKLWGIDVTRRELVEIGNEIGSDVSFFFHGGTAVGTGRGNEIAEREEIRADNLLIAAPDVDISTGFAFELLNRSDLTNKESKSILQLCRAEAFALNLRQSDLVNDFEKTVFRAEPEISRLKKRLIELGAKRALLSGSGASVFAIFDTKEDLQIAFDALQDEPAWRKFMVNTVSRSDYIRFLDLVAGPLH